MTVGGNPFDRIPELNDWEHDPYGEDIDLFVGFARRFGAPVLELACGSGRVLVHLARTGLACTGGDKTTPKNKQTQEHQTNENHTTHKELQSMEALARDQRFRTILIPLDSFGLLLDRDDQLAALTAARDNATHDATLVVDVSNGNLRGGGEPPDELLHHLTAPDARGGSIPMWVVRRPHPSALLFDLIFLND